MSTVREKIIDALTLFWAKISTVLVRKANIVDNCASTSTEYPLSANQGTQLQSQIDELNSNLGTIITQYFTSNDSSFVLSPGIYVIINDYAISGTGDIALSIYNFNDSISFGYAYNLSSPSAVRNNMVRIIELTENTQVGIHATGALTSIGAQLTAVRLK